MTFASYQEALDWIEAKAKEHGGKRKFCSTPEYHAAAPAIHALYQAEKRGRPAAVKPDGLEVGDRVVVNAVGSFMMQFRFTGKVVLRGGRYMVRLDDGDHSVAGRRFVPVAQNVQKVAA